MTLEEKFVNFISTLKSAEVIDDLELNLDKRQSKKADFFFNERQFIGEMKSIKKDMKPKAEGILDKHRDRPEYPIFFGDWEVNKILKHLPDGEDINKQIFYAVTSAIEESIEKANRQIRETKKTFDLKDSEGILFILNDSVKILSPDIIAYRTRQLLDKKSELGNVRYPHISVVCIISEIHILKTSYPLDILPNIVIVNELAYSWKYALDYVNWLSKKWASFNNIPFIETNVDILNKYKFSNREYHNPSGSIRRSEMWRKEYAKVPRLRNLDKETLFKYGQEIWYELLPFSLLGSHDKPTQQRGFELMELGTYFIEEINYRGIDFREFLPNIHEVFDKLQQDGKLKMPTE
jgi:hypothetical protein